jgi:serine/threonine protein kinase
MTHVPFKPGEVLRERYQITQVRRITGMGALYEARDAEASDGAVSYAIKEEFFQAEEEFSLDSQLEAFKIRCDLLHTLSHTAIPHMYDGFALNDQGYLVMEFVEGKDLEDVLNENPAALPIDQIYQWALELSDVLDYLHTRKPTPIVFRDLKPANIMLTPDQHIKLVDYGIVVPLIQEHGHDPLGTDGYAAPEQYRGNATPSVDIYAFGATLHHLLTRRDPRLEPPFSFARRPIRKINPAVPWGLDAIVMHALAFDPWDRYESMAQIKDALHHIRDQITLRV